MRKILLSLFLTVLPGVAMAAWNEDSESFPVSNYGELRPENLRAAQSSQGNNFVCWTRQDDAKEHTDLYLQIVGAEGNLVLPETGKRINKADGPSYVSSGVAVVTTTTGNALMIFGDGRATAETFTVLPYVYAVNAAGELVGNTDGTAIAAADLASANNYNLYDIAGHYYARYDANDPGTYNAFSYIMALDDTGNTLWQAPVKLAGGSAELVATEGGFIAVTKNSNVLSAMKYDYNGTKAWENETVIHSKVSMWGAIPAYADGNGGVLVAYEFTDEDWNSHYPLARVAADGTLTAELLKSVSPEEGWNVSSSKVFPLEEGKFMVLSVIRNGYTGNFFLKCNTYAADGTPVSSEGALNICDTSIAPKITSTFLAPDGNVVLVYEQPVDYTTTKLMSTAVTPAMTKAWDLLLTDNPGISQFCVTHEGLYFVTFFVEAPDTTVGVRGLRATTKGSFELSPYNLDIKLTEAGTLESKLPASLEGMTSMRISGPLNGTDVKVIRDKVALKEEPLQGTTGYITDFNFKNATFVEGGDSYYSYYDMDVWEDVEVKTENDVFPAFFFSSYGLKSIVLPENIKSIGKSALYDCADVDEINIPAGVESIGSEAFAGTAITEIALPDGLKTLGAYMLYSTNLAALTLPEGITTIPEGFVQATFLKEIDLNDRVAEIGLNAFKDCVYLEAVNGYDNVEKIKNYAFYNCYSLGEAPISAKTASIGNEAFSNCHALTNVNIPAATTYIGSRAFTNSSELGSINVAKENTEYASADAILYNKDMTTLICCPSGRTDDVVVPEGVTTIGRNAFEACPKLYPIELPASTTSVGNQAFKLCTSLESLTCMAVVPPTVEWNDPFFGIDVETCKLIVPEQSVAAYSEADGWKKFTNNIMSSIETVDAAGSDAATCRWIGLDGTVYNHRPSNGIYIESTSGRAPRKVILRSANELR